MSKIKFIEAEFHNADKDRRAIRYRLQRFLKTRRALERGSYGKRVLCPPGAL